MFTFSWLHPSNPPPLSLRTVTRFIPPGWAGFVEWLWGVGPERKDHAVEPSAFLPEYQQMIYISLDFILYSGENFSHPLTVFASGEKGSL